MSARPARPRLKPVYGVFYLPERVRLGQGVGYAAEIEDPEGRYAALLRLLDGSRDLPELIRQLDGVLSKQELLDAVQQLDDEGYLEDAAVPPPAEFRPQELERYRANLNFFSTLCKAGASKYDYQLALKRTRVMLLGLGGIGSNVCIALAELGVGHVTGVDFDCVELSNLNRQVLYSTEAVGHPKASAAASRILAFNPDIEFSAIDRRIRSLDDVRQVLNDHPSDLVVHLADRPNGFIDDWVNQACVERRLPLFSAAITNASGVAYSVLPGESACFNCRVEHELARTPQLRDEIDYVRKHDHWTTNGALGPACMFLAYYVTYEILRHVLGLSPLLTSNATFMIDFVTFEQGYEEFKLKDDCAVCGQLTIAKAAAL
jgi:molybdopterin/thiamine biosynthesis adenylyltransferase